MTAGGPLTHDQALEELLEEGRARATSTGPEQACLWEAVVAAAEGGKRFRPALVTAVHEALGGTSPDAAARVGAAVELLHTAFVIHDDVIDQDEVRRGRLNVNGTFASQALAAGADPGEAAGLGHAAGILAGDLALATTVRAVALCGAPADVVRRLLDLVDSALHTTAAGELADVRLALHLEPASLAESLTMEQQKTSAYSFSLPLQAGAVLAGAADDTVERLGEAGRMLGVAFQLVDDLIGVFGEPTQTGKSVTSDLRSRKQTPLLVHATTTSVWAELEGYVGRDLTEDELAEAQRLLTVAGSRAYVEDLAGTHLADARGILDDVGISADLVPVLSSCLLVLADGQGPDHEPSGQSPTGKKPSGKEVAA